MTIKVTLAELKGMEAPLTKLLEQKLPIKCSYKLSKILKLISKELGELEDSRQTLIRNYGEVAEDSITITDPAKLQAFNQEFGDLLKEEIELVCEPIGVDTLGDNTELTVAEVTVLSVLFED